MKTIIPSIIAKNQKELERRIKKVSRYASVLQLDVMDGKFVRNKSFDFDFKLPRGRYEMQLMVKDPIPWIEKHYRKVSVIIPSVEGYKDVDKVIRLIRSKGKKVGLGINPETSVAKIKKYLGKIDMVTVMTVHPGRYGAKFLPKTLEKVKQLRKLKPKTDIEVDGGINVDTISKAALAGANRFVVGSYIQKSKDIKKAIHILKQKVKG
ncbi:ribulose-phosphate 3-epimerase [Candidatus Woesearchaeota archaeon]|nr:ribulose-phosphate 3-epimerase [Candidatus Woesearchaeota archaeon]